VAEAGSLQGRRVLITGAARRVGRALALACAQAGADLVIHYSRSGDEAGQLRDEIAGLGRQVSLVQADLSDPAEASGVIAQATAHGPLYALVNNASSFTPRTWQTTSLADWNHDLAVNLTAPFLLSQAFARQVLVDPVGEGRIVNLLDWRALRPGVDHLPYTIAKAGLAALTRSLGIALAPRITVNGLALGAVLPAIDGSEADALIAQVPAGRWARLDEVAAALLFLLDGPAYVTGEIIHVDGGRHLK
jgi:NAD(P)-dependent dehydrogenase (short-subunit alcohol dehydrogenase family)